MLEWITKHDAQSPDLAIWDPASAGALLAGLRSADPVTALHELDGWLESIRDAVEVDEKTRIEALARIEDAGAPHVCALIAQYLARPGGGQAARDTGWKALSNYLTALTDALGTSAGSLSGAAARESSLLPPAAAGVARTLRACRLLAKVHLVHYLDVPPKLWRLAYAVHAAAESAGCATTTVSLHSATATSVAQELVGLLMLAMGSPEMMAPEQIEVADRVIEQLGGDFTLRPRGASDGPFCFDPQDNLPPRRAAGPQPEPIPGARYFGPGMGYDALERVFRQLTTVRTADVKAYGKDIAPHLQIAAVQHLLNFWRAKCPYTPPAHARASGGLQVIHRYPHIWQHLSLLRPAVSGLAIAEEGEAMSGTPETWTLHDAGGNELGADLPQSSSDWARCGDVVGVSPQGSADCWLGVILCMHAEPGHCPHANIAILSRTPQPVSLRPLVAKGEEGVFTEASARQFAFNQVHAIILSDGSDGAPKPNLLLPPESWKEGRIYEATTGKTSRYLRGLQTVRRGIDYVRATFEWVPAPQA